MGCRLWGRHRVRHAWSDLAAAAAVDTCWIVFIFFSLLCLLSLSESTGFPLSLFSSFINWRTTQAISPSESWLLLGAHSRCCSLRDFDLSCPLVAGSGCFIVLGFVPVARLQWTPVLSCLLIFFYVSEPLDLFTYCRLQNEDTLVPSFGFLYWDIFIKRCFPSLCIWCLRVTALRESYRSIHSSVAQLTCSWPLGPFAVTSSLQ